MGVGLRRAARRACLTAALLCALASLAPVRAQDEERAEDTDEAARPEVFVGAAAAQVASIEADREALLPISDVLRFSLLDGTSNYETDRQTARASLLFPGNGLIQGPNLLCGTFGGAFPPEFGPILDACSQIDYPLSVRADASAPERRTGGAVSLGEPGDPVSADAVGARARATPDGAGTYAALSDVRILGLPVVGALSFLPIDVLQLDPTVLTIDGGTSRTDQRIEDGVLVVEAEATLSGVKLIGGLVRIGSIRSTSRITDDAAGRRTADASLEVAGVTAAGLPAQITDQGLVLGSSAGGPLQQQLQGLVNQLLRTLGIRIGLLEVSETLANDVDQAEATASGLLIEVSVLADGLPAVPGPLGDLDLNGTYVGTVQLGYSAAAGAAMGFPPDEAPADEPDPPAFDGAPPVDFGGGGPGFDPGGPVDVAPPSGDEGALPPAAPPSGPDLVARVTDPFGGRLGLLYLGFAFAVLGLALVPKLLLPARLPGTRP